ncbi:VWA domain-containing protein [Acetobacterium paludosum]|uniref:VWA domain-containing protein n=1 Tax=Acetobacterium paludosum TaxID=52693 RepID=A0A923HSL7_9FIRM|nr:magnesium chelatase subunit D family protein [Acetobacterium paludosum]MBC3887888.1 VWA domain-containing protein [Acetobacterium paludosum]
MQPYNLPIGNAADLCLQPGNHQVKKEKRTQRGFYRFPFAAVIGQEKVKKALLLNLINPQIGGVLLAGEKGTAKSTLVRSLNQVANGMAVVELPLNATEDRVIGSIDIEKTISVGKRSFESGILKKADGNILYIDEVNLLSEHIVNSILEVAASGVNHIEREGIACEHASRFVLIGTMNPEEGFLRSQFLDRFGIYVEVGGSKNLAERKEVIKRRLAFESSPAAFVKKWETEATELRDQVIEAQRKLPLIKISESILKLTADIVNEANCAGNRAELVMIQTAKALAALDNRKNINIDDIKEAAEFALPHRKREKPDEPEPQEEQQEQEQQDSEAEEETEANPDENPPEEEPDDPDNNSEEESEKQEEDQPDTPEADPPDSDESDDDEAREPEPEFSEILDQIDEIGRSFIVRNLNIKAIDRKKRKGEGKRIKTKTDTKQGQYIKSAMSKNKITDLAFDATLRAAAPFQSVREKNGLALVIKSEDIREKVREKRTGSTIVFVVDASGSMGAKKRMETVKGAVVSLLTDAYQKRDRVGLISFRKNEAEVLLNITRSIDLAQKCLRDLPTGGKTPLAAGLIKGYEVIKNEQRKHEDLLPILVLVSDGRTNTAITDNDPFSEAKEIGKKISFEGIQTIVVDTEVDFIKLGLAKELASCMNARYYRIEDLEADVLADAVRDLSNHSLF